MTEFKRYEIKNVKSAYVALDVFYLPQFSPFDGFYDAEPSFL